jgi:hypothetical protein
MDKVELYLRKLIKENSQRCIEGEKLFRKHPPCSGFTGLITVLWWDKVTVGKRHLLVQWARGSADYNTHSSRLAYTGVSNNFIQSYVSFDSKSKRDCAFLILEDNNLTSNTSQLRTKT